MVLFIKKNIGIREDIHVICKMMKNMEKNKNIYKIDGSLNNRVTSKQPFNKYTYKQVEYEVSISMGVVIVYIDDDSINDNILSLLKDQFNDIDEDETGEVDFQPCVIDNYKSTNYTLLSQLKNNQRGTNIMYRFKSYHRTLTTSEMNIKRHREVQTKYVWHIYLVHKSKIQNDCRGYLEIAEYAINAPNQHYLKKSLSVIIYDGLNLFNVKSGTKQINYPSIKQYTLNTDNRFLNITIRIGTSYGLDYEILKCYYPEISEYPHKYGMKCDVINLCDYGIRRVNKDKMWYNQIEEEFDYENQEESERQIEDTGKPSFPNDICFITRAPLYNNIYLLKVGKKGHDNVYENMSYITINSFIYHRLYKNRSGVYTYTFNEYFTNMSGYSIIETYIVQYPRQEIDVIKNIPSDKINPFKKDIMLCISKNGGYSCDLNYNSYFYTVNIKKNIIYMGISNIHDTDILKHHNTNTIIFQCIMI
jgi:hypothetical protein